MIVVIACSGAKQSTHTIAGRMYTSPFYRACLRYALSVVLAECVFILSAKYGLLRLTEQIDPYNVKMGEPGSVSVKTIYDQASTGNLLNEQVIVLGGKVYADVCKHVWPQCMTPLETYRLQRYRGIGLHMQGLRQNHGRLPTDWRN